MSLQAPETVTSMFLLNFVACDIEQAHKTPKQQNKHTSICRDMQTVLFSLSLHVCVCVHVYTQKIGK